MRSKSDIIFMRESKIDPIFKGDNIMLYFFSLNQSFVPLNFPGKIFYETNLIDIVYFFPSLGFCFIGFVLVKF